MYGKGLRDELYWNWWYRKQIRQYMQEWYYNISYKEQV